VDHYNSTQYCNTETVFIYIPLEMQTALAISLHRDCHENAGSTGSL